MARDLSVSARLAAVEHTLAVLFAGVVANQAAARGRPVEELGLVAEEALFQVLPAAAGPELRQALQALALKIGALAQRIDVDERPRRL